MNNDNVENKNNASENEIKQDFPNWFKHLVFLCSWGLFLAPYSYGLFTSLFGLTYLGAFLSGFGGPPGERPLVNLAEYIETWGDMGAILTLIPFIIIVLVYVPLVIKQKNLFIRPEKLYKLPLLQFIIILISGLYMFCFSLFTVYFLCKFIVAIL